MDENWNVIPKLSAADIKKRQADFERWQREYNDTGDRSILWRYLYPMFVDACKVATLKINKHHYVARFEDKVTAAVDMLMKRYMRNPSYSFRSMATLCWWASYGVNRDPKVIAQDLEDSYERLVEETLIHEEEHIDSFLYDDDPYYAYDDISVYY